MKVQSILLKSIKLGDNFRSEKTETDVATLMTSMSKEGLLQPIIVKKKGTKYELMAGHRRYTAAKKLGWSKIDASVTTASTSKLIINGVENLLRENTTSYEIGRLIYTLMKEEDMSYAETAVRFGLKTAEVKTYIKLFKDVPVKYRSKVKRVRSGHRKDGNSAGIISNSVAVNILNMRKAAHINAKQSEQLFAMAKNDASFSGHKLDATVRAIKSGVTFKDAIKGLEDNMVITIRAVLDKKDFTKLQTRYGKDVQKAMRKQLQSHFKVKFY